ncbi:MAG TPA: glycosyltransferase family 4 protein [Solirubrobacteraceae bacterium]|nr:glycosyltransferase family 4 protein [Solirubrobacteraceae bacterium]
MVVQIERDGERAGEMPSPAAPDVTIVANDIGPVGGMERQLSDLLLGLRRLGHHVTVIARTCELPAGVDVEFHRVRGPRRPFLLAHPWFLLAGSLVLSRRRRGIVQANGSIVLNRVDVVAVHYCHQVGPAHPSRSTRLFRAHGALASLLKRVSEPLSYRSNRAAAFVCVSDGVALEMREHFPWLADRVVTIHNGIDTDTFSPGARAEDARAWRAALGLGEGQLAVAFVGSEWTRKGLEPAIRALASAPAWTLIVAGAGDDSHYRELARGLGVGERVRWLGVTSDVQLVYQVADAFVLPSSYETFSLVTFEAAASGLPILATPVSGVRELVHDARNGFLIGRDPEQIAERLNQLAASGELRSRLGAAARRSALEYGSARMAQRYHALYEVLASSQSAGRSEPAEA